MASSLSCCSPRFTCKEGVLHVLIENKWKKKWIILSGSSLIIYKKKSKVRIPKLIFDLKKAIAISSPLVLDPECPPIPPKIPVFRGFAIRFNELAAQKIFAAFAFSHQDCLQWVQCVRFNTNSTQQMLTIQVPTSLDGSHNYISYGKEPKRLYSAAGGLPLIETPGKMVDIHYPSATMGVSNPGKPLAELVQERQLLIRSSSLTEINQLKKTEYECLVETKNIKNGLPPPPPYNPNYN